MTQSDAPNEGEKIVDVLFRAQFGTREQSDLIEAHIKEYFIRWPNYKGKLNHLEWYHLFLDFSDKIEPTIRELRDQLSKERKMRKELVDGIGSLLEMLQPFENMEAMGPLESVRMREIESLIAKASDLDKNQ